MLCKHNLYILSLVLWWRHNDHDGVSNHQPPGCLLNRLFRPLHFLHLAKYFFGFIKCPVLTSLLTNQMLCCVATVPVFIYMVMHTDIVVWLNANWSLTSRYVRLGFGLHCLCGYRWCPAWLNIMGWQPAWIYTSLYIIVMLPCISVLNTFYLRYFYAHGVPNFCIEWYFSWYNIHQPLMPWNEMKKENKKIFLLMNIVLTTFNFSHFQNIMQHVYTLPHELFIYLDVHNIT